MDFNTILEPLRLSLLSWITLYPITTPHQTLSDLTNAEFFMIMLSKVEGFTWSQSIEWSQFDGLSIGQKVKRMRIVGRSITRFYYSYLQLSLDKLAFNYIQMCTPRGEAEVLKLVIAVIGVLMRSKQVRDQFQHFLQNLDEQKSGLLKIMMEYAYNIGQKVGQITQSPGKRQKRLVNKLQYLEQEIQFYQQYTKQLETKIQWFIQQDSRHKKKNEQLELIGQKLVKKIQSLEQKTELLNRQYDAKAKQEEILIQRLAANRKAAEQIVDRLLLENEKQRHDSAHYKKQLSEKLHFEQQYKEIKRAYQQNQKISKTLGDKQEKQYSTILSQQQQLKKVYKQLQELTTKNQGLSIKVQLFQKSFPFNKTFAFSPEQASIVFPTPLGDSYLQGTPKQWFTVEEQNQQIKQENLSQSLTFSNRSNQSNNYPKNKGFLTLKDLQNSKRRSFQQENCDPNSGQQYANLCSITEQKSIQINTNQLKEIENLNAQLQLTMNIIFDLNKNLEYTRKQLRKYQSKQAAQSQRNARFTSKIQKMFG